MTPVYIEQSTLTAGGLDGDTPLAFQEAARALSYLADAGHRIVLVETVIDDRIPERLRALFDTAVDDVPVDGPAWLLTSEIGRCQRPTGKLQTILVGPSVHRASPAVQRCDREARDIRAAVFEILANEAMPGR